MPDITDLSKFYTPFDARTLHPSAQSFWQPPPSPFPGRHHHLRRRRDTPVQENQHKENSGPENISCHFLRTCAEELAPMFSKLFKESVDIGIIPNLWKTSTVIPVPKIPSPQELNHYRPFALISLPMKTLEKLVMTNLSPHIQEKLDPMQLHPHPLHIF